MAPFNFTDYKIEDTTERSVLILYLVVVFLSALVGDFIILFSSIKEDAIKLNKFIVTVMQHVAVCDLVLAVFFILPTIVSLITDAWVFGSVLGYVSKFIAEIFDDLERILITVLAASKLFRMKFPLRAPILTVNIAHITSFIIWLFATAMYGSLLAFKQCHLFFSHVEYYMACHLPSEQAVHIYHGYTIVTAIIPTFVVILVTALILLHLLTARKISRKCGGRVSWHGIVAVSTTATVFCVATIPFIIGFIFIQSNWSDGAWIGGINSVVFIRSSHFIATLNIMCNVYIYYLTIPSFRLFVKTKTAVVLSEFMGFFSCGRRVEPGNCSDNTEIGTIQLT